MRILSTLRLLPELLRDRDFYSLSYSQEGEDLILKRYFENVRKGFFIDIGAHHPKRFSNTYAFYKKGWRGINIDAMPGSMSLFNLLRKEDINLELAISDEKKELTYYMFDEPALNGFSKEMSLERDKKTNYTLKKTIRITTQKLCDVLEENLPKHVRKIDFMSIDVEGLDLQVLQSNDWEKYRPSILLVELLNYKSMESDPIFLYLQERGYDFYAKSHYTILFKDILPEKWGTNIEQKRY